jgi:hypothetical protein
MPIGKIKAGFLKRKTSGDSVKVNREKKLQAWDQIKSVGILYLVPEEKEYVSFTNAVAAMQSEKKEVKTLGLLSHKQTPHYCYPRLAFDYFSRKDLNWFGKPGGAKVQDFISNDFDLLLNLDLKGNPVFDYISAVSSAKLKCGLYRKDSAKIYDLMASREAPADAEALLNDLIALIKSLKQ